MIPFTEKPQLQAYTRNTARYTIESRNHKRSPPYAKRLNPAKAETIFVCCGGGAWSRANWDTWFPGSKVVLPLGDDPSKYCWNCVREFEDCVIIVDDKHPTLDVITALAAELLAHLDLVLYLPPMGGVVRFNPARRAA